MNWNKDRFDEICALLQPFLIQSGFSSERTFFVPVGALSGVNLLARTDSGLTALNEWYGGPTLVDLLGEATVAFELTLKI